MVIGVLVQGHVYSTRPSPWLPAIVHKLLRLTPCPVQRHWLLGVNAVCPWLAFAAGHGSKHQVWGDPE